MGIIADTVNQKGRIERCEVIDSQLIYGKNSVLYIGGIAGKVNGGSLKGCLTLSLIHICICYSLKSAGLYEER